MKRRLLLVTYAFPPQPSPGALRPGYLARYLPEFGWDVTVLTRSVERPPFDVDVVAAGRAAAPPAQGPKVLTARPPLRRVLGRIRDTVLFPDEFAPWVPRAIWTGLGAARTRRFDAVLSTALPISAHIAAACLARAGGSPWIADYRDAWSGNPYMPWGPVKAALERALERQLVKHAAHVTTVNANIAQQLAATHGRRVSVIPNGYDADEWVAQESEAPKAFDLVYTGNLYDGKRSPDVLFQAIRDLREEGSPAGNARVHFYSANNIGLDAAARRYGLESQVFIHGTVARAQVLQRQREAAVLLILLNSDPRTANETGSKYLEYLGARRPMLVCGPSQSVMRDLVGSSRLGWFASDVSEAKESLKTAYSRYARGEFAWHADTTRLPTARGLARSFAKCLEYVCTPQTGELKLEDGQAAAV